LASTICGIINPDPYFDLVRIHNARQNLRHGSWEPKAQFSIGAAVILATWGSGYTNKQHWVLCAQDDFFFYREEYPDAKMKLPEFPLVNATMTDLLQSDAILDLKKAIQGIN